MVDIKEFIEDLKQNINDITRSDLQGIVMARCKETGEDEEKLLQEIDKELKKERLLKLKLNMKKLIDYMENNSDSEDIMYQIRILFGDYRTEDNYEKEGDYYEMYTAKYEIENKVEIQIESGPGDRWGNMTSHEGTDIDIGIIKNNHEEHTSWFGVVYKSECQKEAIERLKKELDNDECFDYKNEN